MRATALLILVLGVAGLAVPTAFAQSFMGLGDLPGGRIGSEAFNVSAGGRFVTGQSRTANGNEAFLWSEQTGMVGLGVPAGSDTSSGDAVSGDGSKVVGHYYDGVGRAFEWTPESGIVDFDPFPAGASDPQPSGISADGGTIVGVYRSALSGSLVAFHWHDGTLTEVATGSAFDVSADGSVVVGFASSEAYIWTAADGVTGLGFLPGGSGFSRASGISADGQVVIGSSQNSASDTEAFRWTESGGMVGLGDLPGGEFYSDASDTTADGSIVVGQGTTSEGSAPFIWDETNGMRNLADVLTDDYGLGDALAGWDLNLATAISDDGKVIVGYGFNPDGNGEAWRAVLVPEPSAMVLSGLFSTVLLLSRYRRT
jgi:probable HAF family extracellular repeat protein